MPYQIATLCGSLRKTSMNRQLLETLPKLAPDDWSFKPLEGLGDTPLYNQEIEETDGFPLPVLRLADEIRSADGLIIASPEYNYGISGVLKNGLDWLSRVDNQPFAGKPISIMSASPSPMGGVRAQYPLRQVFVALNAVLTNRPEVAIAFANERFENGELIHDQTREVVKNHLEAFESLLARRL